MRHLHNASYENSVLPMSAKVDLEALADIILRQSEKLNMFYTKHFYGFEKEGKCDYFQEKQCSGHYFNFRYPLRRDLLETNLGKCLNMPVDDVKFLLPKTQGELREEAKERERVEYMLAQMTPRERRQYERQEREKETMQEDQRAEQMMKDAIT